MHQLWDKLFKIVGDKYPQDLVRFIFPDHSIKIEGKFEQERIALESQIPDIEKQKFEEALLEIPVLQSLAVEWKARAMAEGLTKGKAEGRKEERLAIAKNLLAKCLDYKLIAETTGLSVEEIKKLAQSG